VTRSLTPSQKRSLNVALVAAVAVAMTGFFTGTHRAPTPSGYHDARDSTAHVVPTAPKARDMESVRYGQRQAEQHASLNAMAIPPRALDAPVQLDPAAYAADVRARGVGRAYDGAPPTIPHAVDEHGAPACLACHESGLRVEARVAPVMSHQAYTSCLQCHALQNAGPPTREPLAPSVAIESSFVGLASPGRGERAWPGAPPQIPHRSFMRERCASCHGVWAGGLASSHPYRQNCQQCHEPAAGADQFPRSTFGPLGGLGFEAP
jgi:cytochrome c-type protein NapB